MTFVLDSNIIKTLKLFSSTLEEITEKALTCKYNLRI